MDKALIIAPIGCDPYFDDAYDKENHWQYTKPERTYELLAIVYNDYDLPKDRYDHIIHAKGRKWNLIPEICKEFNWQDYDYIGCWDDDYATDIESVNIALQIARENDFRVFQQSVTSWNTYPCLVNDPKLLYTETNFVEVGVPFFRNDIFRKLLRFLNDYNYPETTSWGLDKVLCYYLQNTAHVVHASTIKHMKEETTAYTKEQGFKEMDYLMRDFFPKYMKEKFNIDYSYFDRQYVINSWSKE